jgi:aminoglycoside/choline kinase family phosphotransferase
MNEATQFEAPIVKFLEDALNANEYQVLPLAGDASNRQYHRIVVGEQSYVLMSWEPFTDLDNYPFLNVLRHFAKHEVGVPQVISTEPSLGQILLEDLGDLTLERKFWETQNQENVLPFYQMAIDELIKIHFAATRDREQDCTAFRVEFDTEKLLWEMNYGKTHLIEGLGGVKLSAATEKEITQIFEDICQKLAQQPQHICHRDFHSRNLMIKLGKMRVIDFQDARLGPVQYDLVSLLHDSYVDLESEIIEKILDYYFEKTKEQYLVQWHREQFSETFQLQVIQRCFKACGSFSSFFNMREDRRYLKYIHPTLMKVMQHLEPLPQYKSFLNLLQETDLLEKDFEKL